MLISVSHLSTASLQPNAQRDNHFKLHCISDFCFFHECWRVIGCFLLALAGQAVGWTADTTSASIQNMRVDHRRVNVLVPQAFLQGADVVAVGQQMGGE